MSAHGKPTDALEAAWRRLLAILADLSDSGWRIPCMTGSPERRALWTSRRADDAERAATLCVACPAMADCRAYIGAFPSEAGVYAGTTEADRTAWVPTTTEEVA